MQGTDAYNAPERSNKADMRKADVWAAGCVLYELFSGGRRLFTWETEQQKFVQLASLYSSEWTPPPLPANVAGWQEVVDAMLTVDPILRALPSDVLRMGNFGCAGLYCFARVVCSLMVNIADMMPAASALHWAHRTNLWHWSGECHSAAECAVQQ